jgi:excisionase family DNA binding protein
MGRAVPGRDWFTASEVAQFCQVDLKTIHNWAEKGDIHHFRTPGRHLRFRTVDVLDFLRKYGYPIPELLQASKPRVLLLEDDVQLAERSARALHDQFEVAVLHDPVRALLAIATDPPDALVVGDEVGGLSGMRIIESLQEVEAVRHVRMLLYSEDPASRRTAMARGASALVPKPDVQQLEQTLAALMGLSR